MMSKYVVGLGRANRQYISESRERVRRNGRLRLLSLRWFIFHVVTLIAIYVLLIQLNFLST